MTHFSFRDQDSVTLQRRLGLSAVQIPSNGGAWVVNAPLLPALLPPGPWPLPPGPCPLPPAPVSSKAPALPAPILAARVRSHREALPRG